jgi:hypothetical protein
MTFHLVDDVADVVRTALGDPVAATSDERSEGEQPIAA